MKPIAPLLAVLCLAVLTTGCETSRTDMARSMDSRPRQDHLTAAEKVGAGLFWLGQSALFTMANETAQNEGPFPH
jgi:hypothetical protein